MTYVESRPDNIDTAGTEQSTEGTAGGCANLFNLLVRSALILLTTFIRNRNPKIRKVLMLTLVALLSLHGGTQEEKRIFLKRLFAKSRERLDVLYVKYRVWRQRKCWTWGGGFRAKTLAMLPGLVIGVHEFQSFDALIPD